MKLLIDLGTRLKMIRLYGSIKQKDLAEKLLIPSPLLSMYEQGKREPSLAFLESFCNHFNMTLSQLFTFHKHEGSPNNTSEHKEIVDDLTKLLSQLEKLKLNNFDVSQS